MVRALDRLKERGGGSSAEVLALREQVEGGQGGASPEQARAPAQPAPTQPPAQTSSPAPIASIPVQKPQPVASEPELAALPASQRTSVLLTASELDILDRLRGMRLPNRVRLNDSDMIRAALQHLNRLTDAQIAEILARTAPLRRGRK